MMQSYLKKSQKQMVINLHIHKQSIQIPIVSFQITPLNVQIQQIVAKYNIKTKAVELIRKKVMEQFQSKHRICRKTISQLSPNFLKLKANSAKQQQNSITNKIKNKNCTSALKQNKVKYKVQKTIKQVNKNNAQKNGIYKQKIKPTSTSLKKYTKQTNIKSERIKIDLRTPKKGKDCICQTDLDNTNMQNEIKNQLIQINLPQNLTNTSIQSWQKCEPVLSYRTQCCKLLSNSIGSKNKKKHKLQVISKNKINGIHDSRQALAINSNIKYEQLVSQFNADQLKINVQQLYSPIKQLQNHQISQYKEITITQLYSDYQQFINNQKLNKLIQINQTKLKKLYQILTKNQGQASQKENKQVFRNQFSKLYQSLAQMDQNQISNFNFQQFKQFLVKNNCNKLVTSFIQ